jgi:hypothetical protein
MPPRRALGFEPGPRRPGCRVVAAVALSRRAITSRPRTLVDQPVALSEGQQPRVAARDGDWRQRQAALSEFCV